MVESVHHVHVVDVDVQDDTDTAWGRLRRGWRPLALSLLGLAFVVAGQVAEGSARSALQVLGSVTQLVAATWLVLCIMTKSQS